MTTSMLQWKDAKKENPPRDDVYLVVNDFAEKPIRAIWENGTWWKPCDMIEFWAAIPTAEQVRQKFVDQELRVHDQATAEEVVSCS